MKLTLEKMTLTNFRGVRSFTFEPNGHDAMIFGQNATGKTTLADAFQYALFGKDSLGRSDFEIKTIDPKTGEALHNLEHAVELELSVDGEPLVLKKVYSEKWTRKRGSSTEEFTGHETSHFIDGVPLSKGEYDQRVMEFADEKVIRLLTDPAAFHNLHWKERRGLLLEVCGDVTDQDVINANEELAGLPDILGKRSLEQHRKIVDARRREINKELQTIPVRIDEVEQGKPETPDRSATKLEAALEEAKSERAEREKERARVTAGGEIAEKKRQLSELETSMQDAARRIRGGYEKRIDEAQAEARRVRSLLDDNEREMKRIAVALEDTSDQIETLERRMRTLREEWTKVDARTFEATHGDTCPACGQALPAEQVEEAHEKALSEFNARKAAELTRIQAEGQELKAKKESLERRLPDLKEAQAAVEKERARLQAELEKAEAALQRLKGAEPQLLDDKEYARLAEEHKTLEAAIQTLREGAAEALEEVDARIQAADGAIAEIQADLSRHEQIQAADARIEQLSNQERDLAREFEKLEHELHICDTFTRTKVDVLTEKINSRFELAEWRLYKTLINGGLEEDCEAIYQGVPYSSLNSAAKVQVGLDIVRTLQEHYDVHPPAWVDGRESVVELPDMNCQVISLIVSANDKKLRVEHATEHEAVAA